MNSRLLTTALVLTMAGTALAQGFEPPPGGPRDGAPGDRGGPPRGPGGAEHVMLGRLIHNAKAAEALGLTPEQIETLRTGFFELQEQKVRLQAELEVSALQQARLITSEEIDEAALMAAVDKSGAVRTKIAKNGMRGLLLMHKTLTPEQREKVRHYMAKRMDPERQGARGDRERGDPPHPRRPVAPADAPTPPDDAPPPADPMPE